MGTETCCPSGPAQPPCLSKAIINGAIVFAILVCSFSKVCGMYAATSWHGASFIACGKGDFTIPNAAGCAFRNEVWECVDVRGNFTVCDTTVSYWTVRSAVTTCNVMPSTDVVAR